MPLLVRVIFTQMSLLPLALTPSSMLHSRASLWVRGESEREGEREGGRE